MNVTKDVLYVTTIYAFYQSIFIELYTQFEPDVYIDIKASVFI